MGIGIIHYSSPPVVGGVESVIHAHAREMASAGYPVMVVSGQGEAGALPPGTAYARFSELNSQNPTVLQMSKELEAGRVPHGFDELSAEIAHKLEPLLANFNHTIIHNVFTKHFNLPLTAALFRLLDAGVVNGCVAWCHDFTWTSPHSRRRVHPGYPWDLLRTYREDITYVTVSDYRRQELAGLLGCPAERIQVIPNGVYPEIVLGLSKKGAELIERLELFDRDLVILMPVRVTQAKNIEYGLHVIAALKASGCRPRLVVSGPPDPHSPENRQYFASLQALRSRLGLEHEMSFVYEMGAEDYELIDERVVGDLYRASDLVFMPSHREGFGMPVLEAGLAGIPVVSTDIPASVEIGGKDIMHFSLDDSPAALAKRLLDWAAEDAVHQMRVKVRQNYTWRAIFKSKIEPLIR